MKYKCNNEGVASLRTMANAITEAMESVNSQTSALQSFADEFQETLGPHKSSLDAALADIADGVKGALDSTCSVAEILNDVAEGYEDVIKNDIFLGGITGGTSGGMSAPSAGSNPGHSSGAGDNPTSKGGYFGNFETEELRHGSDVFVKGSNYQQFISDYYDSENSVYSSYGDNPITETIFPDQIEGIHLGSTEATNPGKFWSQHMFDGTADSFKEIASHIPEVKAQLDAGRSLSDIKEDPHLGTCASIYFEPSNMPRVVKSNGYYEFEGNGRHRILAARELGYDIPVVVVGVRTRK